MLENKKPKNKKKQRNRFLALSSLPFQMGITIYLGAYFGKYLDQKYLTEKPLFTISFVFLALTTSLYSVVQQINRINKDD